MKKLANGVYCFTLGTPEVFTPVSVLQPDSKWDAINALSDHACPFESLGFTAREGACLVEIPLAADEELYGLGLTLKSFAQTGLKKMLRTNCDPVADNGDSHAPVPFYVSTKGYGVLVDTARYASFYMGHVKMRGSRQDLENYQSAGTPKGHWWAKSGSGNVFVDIPAAKGVKVYVFAGDSLKDAVARYNLFSGGGAFVPMWGLGVMYRGYMHADASHLLSLSKTLRDQDIPCDILGLEPGWQSHFYSCSYVWDQKRFPDPDGFLEKMRNTGFRVNLWEHAYIHPSSPLFEPMKEYAADCYVWDGLVPDFSLKEARETFSAYHDTFRKQGVSGFKLDECDNSDMMSNWGFPNFASFPSGIDGECMHSLYGLLYQKTMKKLYDDVSERTFGECRQSYALAAPYPYGMYSDLYNHTDFVRGMASAAFSGILWTPEVRQANSNEELLRRIAATVVSPQAVLNCYMVPYPPWMQFDYDKNMAGEFLSDAPAITDACRNLLQMRMALIPHLYTAFYRYHTQGTPPVRPLVMDYPEDVNTRDIWDTFLLGNGLLAAPVIAGLGDTRRIYLPRGDWYDLYTNEKHQGGQWIEKTVPLDEIALYVREGTLLALAKPIPHIEEDTVFDMEFTAYGSDVCTCYLIGDDGVSNDYLTKGVAEILYTADGDILTQSSKHPRYRTVSMQRVR
jgi:alpha-D-xyloside xylohydrolase